MAASQQSRKTEMLWLMTRRDRNQTSYQYLARMSNCFIDNILQVLLNGLNSTLLASPLDPFARFAKQAHIHMIVNTSHAPPRLHSFIQNTTMEVDAIDVDEDYAEDKLKLMLQEARNRALIQEAEITNEPMDLCFAVVKTCIQGDLSAKNRELNKAIQKYFIEKLEIKVSHQHFYPRPEPDYSDPITQPKLTELVLYGVDFMTTNAIRDRFKANQAVIQEISWVNDSTCRVICASKEETDRLLKLQLQEIKLQDEQERTRGWYALKPYNLYSFQRSLWARYATTTEIFSKSVASNYLIFAEAKNGLAAFLLKQFAAQQKYRSIVEELQSKRRRNTRPRWPQQQLMSRSRQKKSMGFNRRRQLDGDNEQRVNRFQKRAFYPKREMVERKQVRYPHRPIQQDDSFHFNNPQKGQVESQSSFQFSPTPTQKEVNYNTNFNYDTHKKANAVLDNFSERDSDFSYHPVARVQPQQDENRLDYHYTPIIKGTQRKGLDCSFLLQQQPKIARKIDQSDSFVAGQTPLMQDQNFFDFLQSKPKPKEQLDTSFREDRPKQKEKKPKTFKPSRYDDDSY